MTFSSRKFSSAVFFLMCICVCPCGFDVHHLPEARKWREVPRNWFPVVLRCLKGALGTQLRVL